MKNYGNMFYGLTLVFLIAFCFDTLPKTEGLQKLFGDDKLGELKEACWNSSKYTRAELDEKLEEFKATYVPTKKVSGDLLCYFKCLMEQIGVLNKEGDIDIKKATFMLNMFPANATSVDKFSDCVKGLTQIKTCQDLGQFDDCLNQAV